MFRFIKSKNFKKLLFSYLIILIIPIIISGFLYIKIIGIVREDTINANIATLKNARNVIETRLVELEHMANEFNFNNGVQYLLSAEAGVGDNSIYTIVEVHDNLPYFSFDNELIDGYYIYYRKNDIIMTANTTYLEPEKAYEQFFKIDAMSYQEWNDQILNTRYEAKVMPSQKTFFEGIEKERNIFIQSLYGAQTGSFQGQSLFLMNNGNIKKMLEGSGNIPSSYSYIVDSTGEIIALTSEEGQNFMPASFDAGQESGYRQMEMEGETLLFSYVYSSKYNWTYVSAVELDTLLQRVSYIKDLITLYAAVVILLGIIGSISMSYRSNKPFQDILGKLVPMQVSDGAKDEVYSINQAINTLITEKSKLEENVDTQKKLLRGALMGRLINGEFNSEEEITSYMEHVGIQLQGNQYVVIIISIGGQTEDIQKINSSELDIHRAIIEETLKVVAVNQTLCSSLTQNSIVMIYSSFKNQTHGYNNLINELYKHLNQMLNVNTVYYVGNTCTSLVQLHESYSRAKQLLDFRLEHSQGHIVDSEKISKGLSQGPNSMVLEKRLLGAARVGDRNTVFSILDEVYREYILSGNLSIFRAKLLVSGMTATILNVLDQLIDEKGKQIKKLNTDKIRNLTELPAEEAFARAKEIYSDICEYVNSKKKSHNIVLSEKITEYLEENFSDSSLCLSSISDFFGISEGYLSSFFKEQTGENISAYIERIRINKANEMLAEGKKNISVISEEVGYTNTNTFRRAYKKIIGCSPSEYLSSTIDKNNLKNKI